MFWLCLSREEVQEVIDALELFFPDGGVGNDEEQQHWEKCQALIRNIEFQRDKGVRPGQGEGGER